MTPRPSPRLAPPLLLELRLDRLQLPRAGVGAEERRSEEPGEDLKRLVKPLAVHVEIEASRAAIRELRRGLYILTYDITILIEDNSLYCLYRIERRPSRLLLGEE